MGFIGSHGFPPLPAVGFLHWLSKSGYVMPSPMASAPAVAVQAAPTSTATLITFWNIVPSPLTAMSATGSLDRDTTIREGGRRRKAAHLKRFPWPTGTGLQQLPGRSLPILASRQANAKEEIEEINTATRG